MGKTSKGPYSEINIIPLVDIILVILIIFMITAPFMTVSFQVDLPQTKGESFVKARRVLKIEIFKDGKILVGKEFVPLRKLYLWLKEARKKGLVKEVEIFADKRCYYEYVAKVISIVKRAGYSRVSLITKAE